VEDIPSTLDNLQKLLSFEPDIQVVGTAINGKEGVEEAKKLLPDIVLMDVCMPIMDGIEATERLTDEVPNTRVIVMSVQNEPDYLRRAFAAGAFDYLVKPFSGDDLLRSIRFVHDVATNEELSFFRTRADTEDAISAVATFASGRFGARFVAWQTLIQARYAAAWSFEGRNEAIQSRLLEHPEDFSKISAQYTLAAQVHRKAKSVAQAARNAPCETQDKEASAGSDASAPRISSKAKVIRILIVDDMSSTLDNLQKLLSFEPDIEVVGTAANGREAIEEAKRLAPDIILMDINMPIMDGITATQRLSEALPITRVIVMSVQGEPDYVQQAFQVGAFDFLRKPFSGDELVTSIRFVWQIAKNDELMVFRAAMVNSDEPTLAQSVTLLNARLTAWRTLVQMRYAFAWAGEEWRTDPQLLERANSTGIIDLLGSVSSVKEAQLRGKQATETASNAWQIARRVVDRVVDPSTIFEQYAIAAAAHETAKSAAQQAREATARLKAEVPSAGRVLIVEDSPVNMRFAQYLLERHGFEVHKAHTGAECLTELARELPDVILMDIQLPGEDGLTVTRRIRNDSRTANSTIVAWTVHGMPGDREKILAAGCDGYIRKPSDPAHFAHEVAGYLKQRNLKPTTAATRNGSPASIANERRPTTILPGGVPQSAPRAKPTGDAMGEGNHQSWSEAATRAVVVPDPIPASPTSAPATSPVTAITEVNPEGPEADSARISEEAEPKRSTPLGLAHVILRVAGFGLVTLISGGLTVLYVLKTVGQLLVYGWPDPNGSAANYQVGIPFMLAIGFAALTQWAARRVRPLRLPLNVADRKLDWAVQAVDGVNKLVGPEGSGRGADPIRIETPWGMKTEAELAQAVEAVKEVERLDLVGGNKVELENHAFAKHGIQREEQRRQSFGVVMGFHQESHRRIPQNHAVTDLRA
jgi:CheY-like chemotaxis protein